MQASDNADHKLKARAGGAMTVASIVSCLLMTACSQKFSSFDRDYRLRLWETCRIQADHASRKKNYGLAEKRANAAVKEAEHFGESDYRLGISLYALGKILKAKKSDEQAETVLKRAFEVFSKANESADPIDKKLNHEEQARILSTLGELYFRRQKFLDAKKAYVESEALFKDLCRIRDGEVEDDLVAHQFIRCLCGLADVNFKLKDLAAAEQSLQQALTLVDPADYSDLMAVRIRDSLSDILKLQGRTSEASTVQADHLWIQLVYSSQDAFHAGELGKAEKLLRQSLVEASKSGSTVRIVRSLELLSEVLIKEGKDPVKELQQAVAQYDMHPDKNAHYIDRVYGLLCDTYILTGRAPLAQPVLLKWYEYRRSAYGDDSPAVAEVLIATCNARYRIGILEDARKLALQVYKIIYPVHCSSKTGGSIAVKCATALVLLGEPDKAVSLYKEVIKYHGRRRGDDHEQMMSLRVSLAAAFLACQRRKEAQEQFQILARSMKLVEGPKLVRCLPYAFIAANNCYAQKFDPEALVFFAVIKNTFAAYPEAKKGIPGPVLGLWLGNARGLEKRTGRKVL